jgi:hypothetical protein
MEQNMRYRSVAVLSLLALAASACARSPQVDAEVAAGRTHVGAVQLPALEPPVTTAWPAMVVSKNAGCGCCKAWVERMREAGFLVQVHDVDNLEPIRTRVGIPAGKGSCHTAEVGGYFIEGHVPAADIKRLLAEKPHAKGLVLAGMPMGSPGMELPDATTQPYTVEVVNADGSTSPFAQHGK